MTTLATAIKERTLTVSDVYTSVKDYLFFYDTDAEQKQTNITPLGQYRTELQRAGHSEALITDIIEGLAESPLYESQTA